MTAYLQRQSAAASRPKLDIVRLRLGFCFMVGIETAQH